MFPFTPGVHATYWGYPTPILSPEALHAAPYSGALSIDVLPSLYGLDTQDTTTINGRTYEPRTLERLLKEP